MDADAIIVGSGFGGAVAAARLSQAGFSVIVLERGRRWEPGSFPRRSQLDDGWLWDVDRGLYELRWLRRMGSVHAAGWGGGSLAYANVFARPADAALDGRWPAHLRRSTLDPYYDLAAHMVGVAQPGNDPRTGAPPPRTAAVQRMIEAEDIAAAMVRPNLAVTFGDPGEWRTNAHGVPRRGCAFVGECVIGCNHGAKNTLDVTYLAVAEAAGARAITDAEVVGIEADAGGYALTVRTPSDALAASRRFTAARIVLAAGAVASTELLLRARDQDRTLAGLSPALGSGFSGNGDFLSFAGFRRPVGDMTTGPTITTTTVLDVPEGRRSVWFQVQDGAYPPALHGLIDSLLPARRLRRRWRRMRRTDPSREFAMLAMGRDAGEGRLRLRSNGRVTLAWRNRVQAHLYRAQGRIGPTVARRMGARVYAPITWSLFRRTITVHALGGVPAGADPASSVVDEIGEVHGHPGLFVMDGSVIPAATGVNPSATILAATEQSIEQVIRRAGRVGWRAPEWSSVVPTPVPEDAAFDFMSERRVSTAGDGVVFTETMRSRRISAGGAATSLVLRAEIRSVDRFLADPSHPIAISGVADVAGVARASAIAGTLSLFPDGASDAMRYDLRFDDDSGAAWSLTGVKTVRARTPVGLLRGLTALRSTFQPRDVETGAVGGRSILTIGALDVVRLLGSIRGKGFTRLRRIRAIVRFAWFFATRSVSRRG